LIFLHSLIYQSLNKGDLHARVRIEEENFQRGAGVTGRGNGVLQEQVGSIENGSLNPPQPQFQPISRVNLVLSVEMIPGPDV
jgi:hypothetical protein